MTVVREIENFTWSQAGRRRILTVQGIPDEVSWPPSSSLPPYSTTTNFHDNAGLTCPSSREIKVQSNLLMWSPLLRDHLS